MEFDHVGIPTTEKKPGETFVAATRVWITNAHRRPFRVEWLHYEPDSPVRGALREQPHVGYCVRSVEDITKLSQGMKVLLEPFDAGFYQTADGANIELVWWRQDPASLPG
jgi:hypothetical protein